MLGERNASDRRLRAAEERRQASQLPRIRSPQTSAGTVPYEPEQSEGADASNLDACFGASEGLRSERKLPVNSKFSSSPPHQPRRCARARTASDRAIRTTDSILNVALKSQRVNELRRRAVRARAKRRCGCVRSRCGLRSFRRSPFRTQVIGQFEARFFASASAPTLRSGSYGKLRKVPNERRTPAPAQFKANWVSQLP